MTTANGQSQPVQLRLSPLKQRDISPTAIGLLAVALSTSGLVIELFKANLGVLFIGFTLATGGAILAVLGRLRRVIRLASLTVLVVCLVNLPLRTHELQAQRQQLQQQIHNGVSHIKNELPHH